MIDTYLFHLYIVQNEYSLGGDGMNDLKLFTNIIIIDIHKI